jgi:CDGSH-type Zn-finger protein
MEELLSGQSGSEPQIRVSLDGPYVVTNVREFRNWLGEALSATQAMELCRCGQSSNKPFCNGSHSKAKGSGAKDPNRVPDKRDEYDGVGVQISAIAPTHARALRARTHSCARSSRRGHRLEGYCFTLRQADDITSFPTSFRGCRSQSCYRDLAARGPQAWARRNQQNCRP